MYSVQYAQLYAKLKAKLPDSTWWWDIVEGSLCLTSSLMADIRLILCRERDALSSFIVSTAIPDNPRIDKLLYGGMTAAYSNQLNES